MSQVNELQESIKGKGQLLYLSKRAKHEDISLFVHMVDPDILGDFIAEHLNKIEDITGIWVINMIKPAFYPLPKDTKNMKRYAITMKVFPKNLKDVYQNIASSSLPDGLKMAYIAYTFHLFGDCIQFSILAEKEETLNKYLTERVDKIPGVLSTTVNLIERTRPLVSYDEWKQYSSEYGIVSSWDEALMINQFQG
jgi:translation elongation factor EF-1beta